MSSTAKDFPVCTTHGRILLLRLNHFLNKTIKEAKTRKLSICIDFKAECLQVLVEIPYSFFQSIVYVIIVYPMVGYHWSIFKVFWSFYSIFCSLLIFNYFGMLLVVVTPNVHVAFTLRSSFYSIVNLFAGYVMPKPVSPLLTSIHQVCQVRFLL